METFNNQNLITTLDQSLRQTRSTQSRLVARLQEIESEAESLRQEVQALEHIASQTEEAIYSLVGGARGGKNQGPLGGSMPPKTDQGNMGDPRIPSRAYAPPPKPQTNGYSGGSVSYINNNIGNNRNQQIRFAENEPTSQRFADRTITQACTLLLREAGRPMHVNELYQFLMDGGFVFNGNNPTISIAVSLNRNRRFDKVAPGTFDLVIRDASQAVS
jgi:hypothetical protein